MRGFLVSKLLKAYSFIGLMNIKYVIVQLPKIINIVATKLWRDNADIPVSACPTVQPPAVAAPNPITRPPKKTLTNSLGSFGAVSLNSPKPFALR